MNVETEGSNLNDNDEVNVLDDVEFDVVSDVVKVLLADEVGVHIRLLEPNLNRTI